MKTIDFEKVVDIGTYQAFCNKLKNLLRGAGKKILVLVFSVMLALAAAEAAARYYIRHCNVPFLLDRNRRMADFIRLKLYSPSQVIFESRCNSGGYFDEQEFVIERQPGTKRVIAITDSFGATRVPIRYHAFTRAEHPKGEPPLWEIYNMSVNGLCPKEYLYLLKNEGLRYDGDLYVLGFFVGNDLMMELRADKVIWIDFKAGVQPARRLSEKIVLLRLIKQVHTIYQVHKMYNAGFLGEKAIQALNEDPMKELLEEKEARSKVEQAGGASEEKAVAGHSEEWWQDIRNESPVFPEEIYIDIETGYFNANLLSRDSTNYRLLRNIFKEMKRLTKGKFAVVLMPAAYQVDDLIYYKVKSNTRNALYSDVGNADRDFVHNNIKKMLINENIAVIDLLEPMRRGHAKYGRVYRLNDTHFNYWGNDIMAWRLKQFINDYFKANE